MEADPQSPGALPVFSHREADVVCNALENEQGFKITKRGGWQWQRTRMTNPQRAARLWLAVAVATLWLLSVGGMAGETIPESTLLPLAVDDACRAAPTTAGHPIALGECVFAGGGGLPF